MNRFIFRRVLLTAIVLLPAVLLRPPARAEGDGENGHEIYVKGTDTVIGIYRDEMTETVERAIRKGCVYLRDNQSKDGSWFPPDKWNTHHTGANPKDMDIGATAVTLMGLLYAGANADSPTIRRGMAYLARNEGPVKSTYTRAAIVCAAVLSDPHSRHKPTRRLIHKQLAWLFKAQQNNKSGLWRYHFNSNDFDVSVVQFVVEALRMAESYGFQVPRRSLEITRDKLGAMQFNDGSWPYILKKHHNENLDDHYWRDPKLSMTAAAVASMSFLDAALAEGGGRPRVRDNRIDSGLKALARMYNAEKKNRLKNQYLAYSIERAGVLTGTRYLGDTDWYRDIVNVLLPLQEPEGNFHDYPTATANGGTAKAFSTGFVLLFLGKGLAPTVVGKLDWGPPGRATPYDMHNLIGALSREMGHHLNWMQLPIEADFEEYRRVPLIYVTGIDDPYSRLIKHREKIVKYLNSGGTILGAGADEEGEFEKGYRRFIKEIQPESEFVELPRDHEIYERWHDIRRTYGLEATLSDKGKRPVALVVTKPFALPLSSRRGRGVKRATELGVNIIVSLTQIDKRKSFLEGVFE